VKDSDVGSFIMSELSLMRFDEGYDRKIRCRFVSEGFEIDSYLPGKEMLMAEIEKNRPDIIIIGLDLYGRIDGIEISRQIRNRFGVPVMYV
jgi:DNA-binding response OmpR family regulator